MILECKMDRRYAGLTSFLLEIETVGENQHFTNGDIALVAELEGQPEVLSYLDDWDYVVLKGRAQTNNAQYIVQLRLDGEYLIFEPTSSFVVPEWTRIHRNDIAQLPLVGKIVLTVQGRTKEKIAYFSDVRPENT